MAKEITNAQDVIDSRDVIERVEELQDERQELVDACERAAGDGAAVLEAQQALAEWDHGDEGNELVALKALAGEAEGYAADWKYGETLIRDSYFQEYARELADDIGAANKDSNWPNNCIDWEQAARQLQADYTSVDFDGVTYWVR